MPLDVAARVVIGADPDRIASYAMDPANDPVWIGGISEAEMLGAGTVREGSQVRRIASFLGKRIEYILAVDNLEPGKRMQMRSVKSPFPMAVDYTFEPVHDGTVASIRVQGEPRGSYRIGGALMRTMVKRSITRDLKRLKRIVESNADRT